MAYSYECERDGDKCIQRLFGYVRRTAPSPRTVDSPSMTLAQLVRARRGHNLPRQAASFYIAQTDIIRTIIPLCGFGHTEEWKWLPRRITRDGDPMHTPTLARIIVECAVLGAAVVPDRQRTNLPAESAGKLWLNGMRHQKIENRPRLGVLEPIERLRVIAYVRALCGRSQGGSAQAAARFPSGGRRGRAPWLPSSRCRRNGRPS